MISFFWLAALSSLGSAVGGAVASGAAALGGAVVSGASALGGALAGGGVKAAMGNSALAKLGEVAGAGQKIIGGVDSLKQGASKLLGDAGPAGKELNAVNAESANIGTDIEYGAMKGHPGFQRDLPGPNGLQFDSPQGPDMGWEKWRDSRPPMGLGEKLGRSFGEMQQIDRNPFGALRIMGNMKEIWGKSPIPSYLEPGARDATDIISSQRPSFMGGIMRAVTEENLGGYWNHMQDGKNSRRREVLRDYYKSVLNNGA